MGGCGWVGAARAGACTHLRLILLARPLPPLVAAQVADLEESLARYRLDTEQLMEALAKREKVGASL